MDVRTPTQQLLFTTSLIQTQTTSGTGFVFNATSNGQTIPVLISNKHVVSGEGGGSFSLISRRSDAPDQPHLGQRIEFAHPNFSAMWTGHPDPSVDVAATLIGPFLTQRARKGNPRSTAG